MMVWKMIFLFRWYILRFHVNLPGFFMILQVAGNFGWLLDIENPFRSNPLILRNDSGALLLSHLHWNSRPLVRDHPFCHRGFSKIIQHWGAHWLKLIWHTRKPAEYTPPQTNQATSISHKERCHKKEQRNKKRVSKGNFGYLGRVS